MILDKSQHIARLKDHLETEAAFVMLHMHGGGTAEIVAGLKFEGGAVEGLDIDGDTTVIDIGSVNGFTLSWTQEPNLEGMGEYLEVERQMMDAFDALRSACAASKDKDVSKALAALVALEEANRPAADDTEGVPDGSE